MARFLKSRKNAEGAAPGSLIFIGKQKMSLNRITLMKYNEKEMVEKEYIEAQDAFKDLSETHVNWLNIDGLHNTELIAAVGTHFGLSDLAMENILNTGQRAKFFDESKYVTIIAKAITYNSNTKSVLGEQISMVIGKNFLITFQEVEGDQFNFVRKRIQENIAQIRKLGSDYLAYSLLDSIVDNYLIDIENIGADVEELEPLLENPSNNVSKAIYNLKTELSYMRKTIRPMREMLTRLQRSESEVFSPKTSIYFQELYDLTEHSQDAAEMFFSLINDHLNIFNTNVSNRVNDVMKVLTIYASIFIPLTFIAGIYGTNFDVLPELHFKYSYFIMLGVMLLISIAMLIFFRRKRWL